MTKKELRTLIREVLKEELKINKKHLNEGYSNRVPFSCDNLDEIIEKYNSNYAGESIGRNKGAYPAVTRLFYSMDEGSCDVIIRFSATIHESMREEILKKLFENYTDQGEFPDLLDYVWQDTPNSIAFWYGRLDNIGIYTGLSDEM